MYRRLQYVINNNNDRDNAIKSTYDYQRALAMMSDDGICYTVETYFNDFFSEFVTNSVKTAIVDFDKSYPKWQHFAWEGIIPVNNDKSDFYYVGNNNDIPVFYKKGIDY